MALTDTKLRRLLNKTSNSVSVLSDRDSMGARISPKGKIVFQYRYRYNEKQKRFDIGTYPALSLSDARQRIPELRDIVTQGYDIKEYYKQEKAFVFKPMLDDCITLFMDKYVSELRASTIRLYYYTLVRHAKGKINKPVEAVSKVEWHSFFEAVEKDSTPYVVNTLIKQLKTCLRFCSERGYLSGHILNEIATRSVGVKSKSRDRTPTVKEIKLIIDEIGRSKSLVTSQKTVKLIILTGARCGEVRRMEIKDIDFENRIWTVPATKSKTHSKIIRPLAPEAFKIVEEQRDLFGKFTDYLFPATTYMNAITSQTINKFCRCIRGRLDIEDWTAHDFRRSISTTLVDEGVEPYVTEKILGHSLGGVFSIYNKSSFIDDQLRAYKKWETLILTGNT